MDGVPKLIGRASVLKVANLSNSRATGNTLHIVGGRERLSFARLAIVRDPSDAGFYLLYCDERWSAITDTWHESLADAVAQAEYEYQPIEFVDP